MNNDSYHAYYKHPLLRSIDTVIVLAGTRQFVQCKWIIKTIDDLRGGSSTPC